MSSTSDHPTLDIVIVNWNSGVFLEECIQSLAIANRRTYSLRSVVIIDNASTDGSLEPIVARAEATGMPLQIVRSATNRGFGAACNQGARLGNACYVLFLNPDTRLFPDSLDIPLAFLERAEGESIGICGIRTIDATGNTVSSCYRFPTVRTFLWHMTGLSTMFPHLFKPHQLNLDELRESRVVDQVMGAFFLVRRKLYEALNGFDERFFVYFEEVDFSYRARQRGIPSYYLAGASLRHEGCGSTRNIRARRLFYSLRSRLQYALKHFGPVQAGLLAVLTISVELVSRVALAVARRSPSMVGHTLCAYFYLCRAGFRFLGRRANHSG